MFSEITDLAAHTVAAVAHAGNQQSLQRFLQAGLPAAHVQLSAVARGGHRPQPRRGRRADRRRSSGRSTATTSSATTASRSSTPILLQRTGRAEDRAAAGARLNTETPGSTIDRLSILSLRRYHMQEQADRTDASEEHRAKVRTRLDPGRAAPRPVAIAGRTAGRHLRRPQAAEGLLQFKMYNDPTMNPYLYGKEQPKAGHRKW